MKNFYLNIEAVLERELFTAPPLMPVIVAKLNGSKQDIPKAFRLTKDLSTFDLKHLRRIRNLPDGTMECILCKHKETSGDDEIQQLEERFAVDNLFENYRIAQVPSSAPKTDHQLKACTEIWPCKFAKSNYLIQCIEGTIFSESERLVLTIIVNSMVEHIRDKSDKAQSGAVVFRCATIYGLGLSDSEVLSQNPVKHSAMVCIDSVAEGAGAGHWKCSTCVNLKDSIQKKLDEQKELEDHRIDARFLPYLCTNYDIFVTEEPCFMCTMGLVQSRIRRLFYLDNESVKKLTNGEKLCYADQAIEKSLVHRDKNLNHRFEAWKIGLVPVE